jgi:hypothetical protein
VSTASPGATGAASAATQTAVEPGQIPVPSIRR